MVKKIVVPPGKLCIPISTEANLQTSKPLDIPLKQPLQRNHIFKDTHFLSIFDLTYSIFQKLDTYSRDPNFFYERTV